MSGPIDDAEFLNTFIASLDATLEGVTSQCIKRDIPESDVSLYLVLSMSSMARLIKVLHTLKAQSYTIEMLRTSLSQLKNATTTKG